MDFSKKARIRVELFYCAALGLFMTYKEFFERINPSQKMGNWPYTSHFDAIAKEERNLGYPDITYIVRGGNGYPSQIDFRDARPFPDQAQLDSLCAGTDEIIRLYCPPGTPNRYKQ